MSVERGRLARRPEDLREAAKRRGRQIRRRRRVLAAAAAVSAVTAAAVAVAITLPGGSPKQTTVELSPTGEATSQRIVALTSAGALEELTYPAGSLIRQIAPPSATVRCYGASPPCLPDTPPETQASLAYDPQMKTVFLSLNGYEIDAFPTNGGTPHYVADGDQPAVSPDGTMLAFHPGAGQLGKGTVTVRNLATGQDRTWVISAATVAAQAGLPYPTTAEDTQAETLSWAPDGIHLAVTMFMSFGLNDANTDGTTFDEVLVLDTTKPVSDTNPTLVGPLASSMTGLREQSDGKGWTDAIWIDGGAELLALHLAGDMNAGDCMPPQDYPPIDVTMIAATTRAASPESLSQPPDPSAQAQIGVPYTCGAQLLGVNQGGTALFIGSGPPRLEAWNTTNRSPTLQLVATNIGAATWESTP